MNDFDWEGMAAKIRVLQPQLIGYQVSPSSEESKMVITQVVMRGDGILERTSARMRVEKLGQNLHEALAVLMVLPKEGGYITGVGGRCGDEFFIERGRLE